MLIDSFTQSFIPLSHVTHSRSSDAGNGGRGATAPPPISGRSVNPNPTGGGILSPPDYQIIIHLFDTI